MEFLIMFIFYLLVASACAWIADYFVPGRIPGGFIASAIIGVLGAWLGSNLLGPVGPQLAGVPLLPAIAGSALLVFLFSLISPRFAHKA